MSYQTQAILARDNDIILRLAACAATQNIENPEQWAWNRSWKFSAQSGWDTAYAAAIKANTENPGKSETIITDSMILKAVQAVIAAEKPAAP